MTIFKSLNIQTTKNYDDKKTVRRHIGLTPRNALAIEELKVLYEDEANAQAYPSDIINWAMDLLINEINNKDDGQIDFIINGIDNH